MPRMTPVNMSVEGVHAAAGLPSSHQMPVVPTADELDSWAQENYSLSVSAAANLGFPVGNVSGSVQHDALMFGASRWRDVVSGEHTYRFGVALRALVVVSEIKVSGALTLPVVAAKVELEGARASAQLMVRGYQGSDLAGLLPTWQSFGVDSYAQYMAAVSSLQKAIMSDAASIQPELLATTVFSRKVADPGEAVGSVYGLHAIAEGATLAHALDKLGVDDPDISQAVKTLYESVIGEDDRAVPSQQQQQNARATARLSSEPDLVQRPIGGRSVLILARGQRESGNGTDDRDRRRLDACLLGAYGDVGQRAAYGLLAWHGGISDGHGGGIGS